MHAHTHSHKNWEIAVVLIVITLLTGIPSFVLFAFSPSAVRLAPLTSMIRYHKIIFCDSWQCVQFVEGDICVCECVHASVCVCVFLFLFRSAHAAYGSSQARSWIWAAGAGLHCSRWICELNCSLQQCWILNPLSKARGWTHIVMDTSPVVLNPLSTTGTPHACVFYARKFGKNKKQTNKKPLVLLPSLFSPYIHSNPFQSGFWPHFFHIFFSWQL